MKRILYIGNNLRNNKTNVSSIRTLGPLLENIDYKVEYASHFRIKLIRLLHMIYALLSKSFNVDYVIIDTYSTLNFYYAFIISQLCRLMAVKYIINLNGGNLPNRLSKSPILSKAIFKNAYINIAPSNYLLQSFKSFGYTNLKHIPNTIEIKNYPFKIRDNNKIKLLWVRSFSKIYNPELAVLILKKLLDNGFDASLCMIGPDVDGSLKKVEALAKELHVEVKFTGKLTKKEWTKRSEDFSFFINTTNFDNMPVSVIEAMALGLPVISTNVGGMPYLIENEIDGILVEPNNVDEFVKAIKKLKYNREIASSLATAARKKVEAFDWAIIKKEWHQVLS